MIAHFAYAFGSGKIPQCSDEMILQDICAVENGGGN
jgi:hypothetical protein